MKKLLILPLVILGTLTAMEVDALTQKSPVLIKIDWESVVIKKVKDFEGFSAKPYICAGKQLTIGYGSTTKGRSGTVTKAKAESYLREDLNKARKIVDDVVTVKLTERQAWTLTSFTYNCGRENLELLVNGKDRLNGGNYASVPKLLPTYCKAKGKTLKGLKIRREWEASMWNGDFKN